jgi:hypothetical protein
VAQVDAPPKVAYTSPIAMNGKFRCLSIAVMMLNVWWDRNHPVSQHIMTPLWHAWMRQSRLHLPIVIYGRFPYLSIAEMMLNVWWDRNHPDGQHIMTPLGYTYMRKKSGLYLTTVMYGKFLCDNQLINENVKLSIN